jgi:rare lipoprotein A
MCAVLFYLPVTWWTLSINAQEIQQGKASYYSKRSTGARTASGERMHHDSLTCAHKKYPFGTMLKVTNTINGKQVIVRVTDRGPFTRGRIIDLSWGAAKELGMLTQGICMVTVEEVKKPNIPYKYEEDGTTVQSLEFNLADINPADVSPAWLQDTVISHQKVQRTMRHTVTRSRQTLQKQKRLQQHTANAVKSPSGIPASAKQPAGHSAKRQSARQPRHPSAVDRP